MLVCRTPGKDGGQLGCDADAGLQVFNELVGRIALDRERNSEFDDRFLQEKMEELAETKMKPKTVVRVRAVCDSLEI